MRANIFGSNFTSFSKSFGVDKKYVDSKFITLTKTLHTKLDKIVSEELDMNGYRIFNVLDPINNADAANKKYVEEKTHRGQMYTLSTVGLVPVLTADQDEPGYTL